MSELVRLILDSIEFLWPLHRVNPWEQGLYVFFGRWTKVVGPGNWPKLPWFIEVRETSMVPAIASTARLDITLTDGASLTFSATANLRVIDLQAAYMGIDDFHQSAQETLAAVMAEKLAEVDASRLTAEKRGRLLSDLRRWVNEETREYGVEISKLRFTNFVVNAKTFRLLQDASVASW